MEKTAQFVISKIYIFIQTLKLSACYKILYSFKITHISYKNIGNNKYPLK